MWQDIQHHYTDKPDRLDEIDAMIDQDQCEFDLSAVPCKDCGDGSDNDCFFLPDGGFEPRDGTYLCRPCIRKRFMPDT